TLVPGPLHACLSASGEALWSSAPGNRCAADQCLLVAASELDRTDPPRIRGISGVIWYSTLVCNFRPARRRSLNKRSNRDLKDANQPLVRTTMNFFAIPLSRTIKQLLMMLADGVMLALALWLSFALLSVDYRTLGDNAYLYLGAANVVSVLVFF